MKKLLVLLMISSLTLGCLTACGNMEDEDSSIFLDEEVKEEIEEIYEDIQEDLEKETITEDETTEIDEEEKEEVKEEKIIETTTINLYDGTEFELSNEFEYTGMELSSNIITEPFVFTEFDYQLYPNTPLKYIKDVIYKSNKDGTYRVLGTDDIEFEVINTTTNETILTEKRAEDTYITGFVNKNLGYPNVLDGIDKDFMEGIEEFIGKPTHVVANYPSMDMGLIYYLWLNEDDTVLVYLGTYYTNDNTYSHIKTYITTVRGLEEGVREAIGLEVKDADTEPVVMKKSSELLSKYVDTIDVYGLASIVKEEYMSDENFNKLKENYFNDLPLQGTTFKEYAPDNSAKGTYEPGEDNFTEPDGNYEKLYFSNKTDTKCTPNNLTVDAATKTLSNPGIGTPDLLVSDMLETYGQPNAISDTYFIYVTKDFYICFEREAPGTTMTNRKNYFDTIVKIYVYYRDSVYLGENALDRIAYFDSLNQ